MLGKINRMLGNIAKIPQFHHEKTVQERLFFYRSLLINNNWNCKPNVAKSSNSEVIISLTSYGSRVNDVYLTMLSLMYQTVKANKIILWLSKEEFTEETIPTTLKGKIAENCTIAFTEDLLSYKKIIPTLKLFPNSIIITCDDDIIYPIDFVERLLIEYNKHPDFIHFNRGCMLNLYNNDFLPYIKWKKPDNNYPLLNVPTGIGGVLYPPNCFHEDVLDEDIFMELCPKADDLWLKTMCLLNGRGALQTPFYINKNFYSYFFEIEGSQSCALHKTNTAKLGLNNDVQIKNLNQKYDLIGKISNI